LEFYQSIFSSFSRNNIPTAMKHVTSTPTLPIPLSVMRMRNVSSSAWDSVVKVVGPTPYYVWVVGRLRVGVSLEAARAEMSTFYTRVLQQQSPSERLTPGTRLGA
jgi:hypothetical protein